MSRRMPVIAKTPGPDATHAVAAVVILIGVLLFGTAGTLSAQAECSGEISLEFNDVQLLNSDSQSKAGPYNVQLAAGTYDVSTMSFDHHSSQPGAGDQSMEQWYFTLDSGFTSPFTSDVPANADLVSDTWRGLIIDESTALTIHHQGSGGVNSVWPRCISFDRVDLPVLPDQEIATPPDQALDVDSTTSATADQPDPGPSDAVPEAVPEAEVLGVVEERLTVATSSAATANSTSLDSAQQTVPVLALTGPRSQQFVVIALALLAIGTGLMAAAGLKELVDDLEESKHRRGY